MASINDGKDIMVTWARKVFNPYSTALDVGACDGKWASLLGDHFTMDAVEIFKPNITKHKLRQKYRKVYNLDICDFEYQWYDLIIFGDVIEHMTVPDARMVLRYAYPRCRDMIIAVPYLWSQPEIYGNKWEKHIQNDLTDEIFNIRYPGFENIIKFNDYGYYHKKP